MRVTGSVVVDVIAAASQRFVGNRPDGTGRDFEVVSHVPVEIVPTSLARGRNTDITTVVRVAVPFVSIRIGVHVVVREVREVHFRVGGGSISPIEMARTIERTIIGGKSTIEFIPSLNPITRGGLQPSSATSGTHGENNDKHQEGGKRSSRRLHSLFCCKCLEK